MQKTGWKVVWCLLGHKGMGSKELDLVAQRARLDQKGSPSMPKPKPRLTRVTRAMAWLQAAMHNTRLMPPPRLTRVKNPVLP